MLCCSPDFTHPDAEFRRDQVEREKRWIDMTAELGGSYCRVLSGQRRPELSREAGLGASPRNASPPVSTTPPSRGVTLILENHYKDNYWDHPEFAQSTDMFCDLVSRINSPHFGVNYDPSNAYLAGDDPLELLGACKASRRHHACQRSLSDRRHARRSSPRRGLAAATPPDCATASSAAD